MALFGLFSGRRRQYVARDTEDQIDIEDMPLPATTSPLSLILALFVVLHQNPDNESNDSSTD